MSFITAVRSALTSTSRRLGQAGAALVEYTLLVALIAAVAIAAVGFLGSKASESMCSAGTKISENNSAAVPTDPDCDPNTP